MKRNVPFIGFLIGILLPGLGFLIMSKLWGHGMSLASFVGIMKTNHQAYSKVLTMSLLINLVPFLYFKTKRLDYSMNGVVVATMLYAVYIVMVMFVWY